MAPSLPCEGPPVDRSPIRDTLKGNLRERMALPTFNPRLTLFATALLAFLCLGACATSGQGLSKEQLLSAAGFKAKPANTAEKMAELRKLPQLSFIQKERNGKQLTLYADAQGCRCLYVGDQSAFQAYLQEAVNQHEVVQTEAAATQGMNESAAAAEPFSWGPWGEEDWTPH